MGLKLDTGIPFGNARQISISQAPANPEVTFTAEPRRNPDCLWFCFRLIQTTPGESAPGKVKLVLKYFQNFSGNPDPLTFRPVIRKADQNWMRMKPGNLELSADGQYDIVWNIDYPQKYADIASCYPYGKREVETLLKKSRGYWRSDSIGLSRRGRPLIRLSNDYGVDNRDRPGIYLSARQVAGETPGSWVLDGVLRHFSRLRNNPFLIWTLPLLDMDGIVRGDFKSGNSDEEIHSSWGSPPKRCESLALQQDLLRWKARCKPALVIDFRARGVGDTDGITCRTLQTGENRAVIAQADKWANIFKDALSPELAAGDFKKKNSNGGDHAQSDFLSFTQKTLDLVSLQLEIPYALARGAGLTCKVYREAGKRIANAILKKYH